MGTPTAQDVALLVEGRTAPASSAAPQADWVRGAQTQRAAHRAVQACQNGQLPQAIAEAWAAVAQSPSKAENYALLGYILAKAGHHDRALGMYAKAAQLEPDTPAYQRRLWRHAAHHRPGYLHSLQGPALPALGCDEAAGVAQAKTHLGATGACAYVDGDIQYWIPVDGRTDGTGLQITSFKSGTWATQRIQLSAPPDSQLLHGRLPWPKGAEACVLTLCQDGARLAGSPLFGPHTLALPKAVPEDTDIVRVILPVYDGLDDLRACINALQAAPCKTPFTLILVLDCPPDPAITAFVQQLAARDGITVIENRENLGFTASVNQGLRRSGGADVVLLNSDTVVSAGWLDRLSAAAHSAPDIGTVTPLSNNGEITSYPVRSAQNPLPPGVTAAELDALAAEVNQGVTVDLPTGVGFCLFVKADCLAAVGLLDAHRFGKGYGEETDFCLRALRAGWRSVCAADVFVAHVSSVSFGAEKQTLIHRNMPRIRRRYPEYTAMADSFVQDDPLGPAKQALEQAYLRKIPQLPDTLVIAPHDWRTDPNIQPLRHAWLASAANTIWLFQDPKRPERVLLRGDGTGSIGALRYDLPQEAEALRADLACFPFARIHWLTLPSNSHVRAAVLAQTAPQVLHLLSANTLHGLDTAHEVRADFLPRMQQVRTYSGFGARWAAALGCAVECAAPPPWPRHPKAKPPVAAPGDPLQIAIHGQVTDAAAFAVLLQLARAAAQTGAPLHIYALAPTLDDAALWRTGCVSCLGDVRAEDRAWLTQALGCAAVMSCAQGQDPAPFALFEMAQGAAGLIAFDGGCRGDVLAGHPNALRLPQGLGAEDMLARLCHWHAQTLAQRAA